MSKQTAQIKALLPTLHDAFKRQDMDKIAYHFDDDVHFISPDGEMFGKQARIADEQRVLDMFDEPEIEITSVVADGNEAIEMCVLHGLVKEGPAAGGRVSMRYVVHYRFKGEFITFQEVCFDRVGLQQQLEVLAA